MLEKYITNARASLYYRPPGRQPLADDYRGMRELRHCKPPTTDAAGRYRRSARDVEF